MNNTSIITVIVTHNRLDSLLDSVHMVMDQSHRVSEIIVVDNANSSDVQTALAKLDFPIHYLPSSTNLGGAGGFAYGILTALAHGADWVWLADDDGKPASTETLRVLLDTATQRQLGHVSPVVVDINDPAVLSFPLRQGVQWRRRVADITSESDQFLAGSASLFNGALFRTSTLLDIGVPDLRLFIRGDEVEMHRRLVRSTIPFGTALNAYYMHPNGTSEFYPIMGGKAHAQYPDNVHKRFFTYRNRGLLLSQPGMTRLRFQEWVRFTWFFLLTRRDRAGYAQWRSLHKIGRSEQFRSHYERENNNERGANNARSTLPHQT